MISRNISQKSFVIAEEERALNASVAEARAEREARLVVERTAKAQITQQAEELRQLMAIVEEERKRREQAERQAGAAVETFGRSSPLEVLGDSLFGGSGGGGGGGGEETMTREQFKLKLASTMTSLGATSPFAPLY